jgi:Domain of unknown function (DUF6456)
MSGARSKRSSPSRATAIQNDAESPLAWLRRRKDRDGAEMISQAQFDAGERLRADFWFAQMTPRVSMNWQAMAPSQRGRRSGAVCRTHVDMLEGVAAARERVSRALAAVGPELADVLIDVCCHLKGLEQAERAAGWPQRSGKVVLQLALTRLSRHYGIVEAPVDLERRTARVRHWGSEDYRPLFELPVE